jgi:hypothetical protein
MKILNNWNRGLGENTKVPTCLPTNELQYCYCPCITHSLPTYMYFRFVCFIVCGRPLKELGEGAGVNELKGRSLFCKIDLHSSVPGTASKHFHEVQEPGILTDKFRSYLNLLYTNNVSLLNNITTVEPGYNDIGLYYTSLITSDILRYQLTPHY